MTDMPVAITDLNNNQLQELAASCGEPAYRAEQLQRWVYREFAHSFEEMINLPVSWRQELARKARLHSLALVSEARGYDETTKILFALADGKTVESALMSSPAGRGDRRYTVCLSTQVGCAIGCPFCATGQQGFERNLSPGEIIDQVLYFARRLRDEMVKPEMSISNLVFMGMGEPLANYDALLSAIDMLNSPRGFGLGVRNMVVSTAGLIPQLKRLMEDRPQIGLAISLHASDNKLRNQLVPINQRYPLEQLIPACREYVEKTGRRISFEYILFEGINDSREQVASLARLLAGLNCHVNLILANQAWQSQFRPPAPAVVLAFQRELRRLGINCTLRRSKGQDINAGCGQLRSRLLASADK